MKIVREYINEIVLGRKSGIDALGIGSRNVTRFYDKIKEEWPDSLDNLINPQSTSGKWVSTKEWHDYVQNIIEKLSIVLECDPKNIFYMKKIPVISQKNMGSVVTNIKFESGIEPFIIRNNLVTRAIDKPEHTISTITPIPDWNFAVMSQKYFLDNIDNATEIYYFIKVPEYEKNRL